MKRLLLPLAILVGLVATSARASRIAADEGPRLGAWEVEGRDGVDWTALLVLSSGRTGYFDWLSSSGARGRELLTWSFEPGSRTIRLEGEELIEPVGNITRALYEATVSVDGTSLRPGRWGGPGAAPGTWTADWTGE